MASIATASPVGRTTSAKAPGKLGALLFGLILGAGVLYAALNLKADLETVPTANAYPFLLLGIALLIALGFEFINGFHDTANAVATVIYTHTLSPNVAVAWSGFCNFLGVLMSGGAVAFGIVTLLPIDLVLQVGRGAGFSMVFALLMAAILWNLGTWWFGLPSSSSHALVGSIIGVGIANQWMRGKSVANGVDWNQAASIGKALLFSPLAGFAIAGLLLLTMRALIPAERLYKAPEGAEPPPFWIRCLLFLTCSGVSFFHGSNDGQKGMGLIMLILIGTVPTAYALNHAMTPKDTAELVTISRQAASTIGRYVEPGVSPRDPRATVTEFVRSRKISPGTMAAMREMIGGIGNQVNDFGALKDVPSDRTSNLRNDMYLVSEAVRRMQKSGKPAFQASDMAVLPNYRRQIDNSTKFIPTWVKVAVALALGMGTLVGWKRIVITVGEKLGKAHMSYAQGAAAEITTMLTIGAADGFGLPVSTTHVLSSGVAGTMTANRIALQWGTVRNLLIAWTLTLPASTLLAGTLYWAFRTTSGS
jgi:PiT family inorganic phosphate transporter